MQLQLWSYNYDPEPSGIAPLSRIWAHAMQERGHEILVVAAHPHYPKAIWGSRRRPYRERRDGIPILRLPLWMGRGSSLARVRQEVSYMTSLGAVSTLLPSADAVIAVSPCFPALLPTMITCSARRIPWVLWLQDILPDGAATTGLLREGALLDLGRALERAAYGSADRIVVISGAFERNLRSKGVDAAKIAHIYNPSAVAIDAHSPRRRGGSPRRRLLIMGNIGHTQGLPGIVRTLETSGALERLNAEVRIAGHGVEADEVAHVISSDRVKMLGLLFGRDLEDELATASIGLVTQRSDVAEFNLPSKLMNYMAHGVPVLAVVSEDSETARIVREAQAGWVVDSKRLDDLPPTIAAALDDPEDVERRASNAHAFARREFAPERIAERFEDVIAGIVDHEEALASSPRPS